jgi:hypothetical protein
MPHPDRVGAASAQRDADPMRRLRPPGEGAAPPHRNAQHTRRAARPTPPTRSATAMRQPRHAASPGTTTARAKAIRASQGDPRSATRSAEARALPGQDDPRGPRRSAQGKTIGPGTQPAQARSRAGGPRRAALHIGARRPRAWASVRKNGRRPGRRATLKGRRPPCRPIKSQPSQCGSCIIPTWRCTDNAMEHRGHVKWTA